MWVRFIDLNSAWHYDINIFSFHPQTSSLMPYVFLWKTQMAGDFCKNNASLTSTTFTNLTNLCENRAIQTHISNREKWSTQNCFKLTAWASMAKWSTYFAHFNSKFEWNIENLRNHQHFNDTYWNINFYLVKTSVCRISARTSRGWLAHTYFYEIKFHLSLKNTYC